MTVAAHADRLRFKPATIAPALVAGLTRHKGSILAALAMSERIDADIIDRAPRADLHAAPTLLASEEARHTFAERLGIAAALGMETTPGAPAWLIALGESMHTDAKESARNLSQGLAPLRNTSHNASIIEGR